VEVDPHTRGRHRDHDRGVVTLRQSEVALTIVFADALKAAIHNVDLPIIDVFLQEVCTLLEFTGLEFADAIFVGVKFLFVGVQSCFDGSL